MLSTRYTNIATLLLAAVMMTILFVGVGTPVAHAQSLTAASAPPPCVGSALNGIFCLAPSVNITCGGAIGQTNDFNGVPINWTFNTQSPGPVCVTVTYTMPISARSRSCGFLFYVPNGDATGDVFFHFSNGATVKLDENPVSGFTGLGVTEQGVTQVTFTDVNDQPTNSRQIGWGSTSSFSLKVVCN